MSAHQHTNIMSYYLSSSCSQSPSWIDYSQSLTEFADALEASSNQTTNHVTCCHKTIGLITKITDTINELSKLQDSERPYLYEALRKAHSWCFKSIYSMEPLQYSAYANGQWCHQLALLIAAQILSEELAINLNITPEQEAILRASAWANAPALRKHLDDPVVLRHNSMVFVARRTESLGQELLFKGCAIFPNLLETCDSTRPTKNQYSAEYTLIRSSAPEERVELSGIRPRMATHTVVDLSSGAELKLEIWQASLFFNFSQLRRVGYSWMPNIAHVINAVIEAANELELAAELGKTWQASLDHITCYDRHKHLGFGIGPGRQQLTDVAPWPFHARQVASWLSDVLSDFAALSTAPAEQEALLGQAQQFEQLQYANATNLSHIKKLATSILSTCHYTHHYWSDHHWLTPYRPDDDGPREVEQHESMWRASFTPEECSDDDDEGVMADPMLPLLHTTRIIREHQSVTVIAATQQPEQYKVVHKTQTLRHTEIFETAIKDVTALRSNAQNPFASLYGALKAGKTYDTIWRAYSHDLRKFALQHPQISEHLFCDIAYHLIQRVSFCSNSGIWMPDLKPANIVLDVESDGSDMRVSDLRLIDPDQNFSNAALVPEQLIQKSGLDHKLKSVSKQLDSATIHATPPWITDTTVRYGYKSLCFYDQARAVALSLLSLLHSELALALDNVTHGFNRTTTTRNSLTDAWKDYIIEKRAGAASALAMQVLQQQLETCEGNPAISTILKLCNEWLGDNKTGMPTFDEALAELDLLRQ